MGSESFDLHCEFGTIFLGAKIWKVHFEYTVVALCFFLHQSLPFFAMSMPSIHTYNIICNIIIRTYISIYIYI